MRLTKAGVAEMVVKCDTKVALISPGAVISIKAILAPVDTTAAGDNFNAAYLAARLSGKTQAEAAIAGIRLAGLVVTHRGALTPRSVMP